MVRGCVDGLGVDVDVLEGCVAVGAPIRHVKPDDGVASCGLAVVVVGVTSAGFGSRCTSPEVFYMRNA